MKHTFLALAAATGLALVLASTGCTQMPTEKQGVTDMRPHIAFKIASSEQLRDARVLLDGLDMGAAGDYLDGVAALRVVPGTHQLTVALGKQVLLQENFYAGDGVNRTFILK